MNQAMRNYRGTFIIDDRGRSETAQQLIDAIKAEIVAAEGEVTGVEDLGKRDFARVPEPKITSGAYVHIDFKGKDSSPSRLQERLKLVPHVYRVMVQSA